MMKQKIISYYESAAHENEVRKILERAKKVIDFQETLQNRAIVLDIDETSLNHYKSLKDVGFPQEENHSVWEDLIAKTNAEAIKPTLDFYQYCINKKIKIFFISARFASHLDATKQALQNAGYVDFEDIFVFPEDISIYSSENFKNFKAEKRAYIESLGYKILISIGDQSSDLTGGYALNTFQLPNYLYGENSIF